jgi:hypothetical protein
MHRSTAEHQVAMLGEPKWLLPELPALLVGSVLPGHQLQARGPTQQVRQ